MRLFIGVALRCARDTLPILLICDRPALHMLLPASPQLGPLVGIAVELADDAGDPWPGRSEMIAAVAVAGDAPVLTQPVERTGDLASVVAADRLDDVGVEHRGG